MKSLLRNLVAERGAASVSRGGLRPETGTGQGLVGKL